MYTRRYQAVSQACRCKKSNLCHGMPCPASLDTLPSKGSFKLVGLSNHLLRSFASAYSSVD